MELQLPDIDTLPIKLATKLIYARCLILNADYQPINYLPLSTLDWKRAIMDVMLEKVDVIATYDDVIIHSALHSFEVPSVVVSKVFRKPRKRIEFSKSNVFLRDSYICQFCGVVGTKTSLTFDHWIPKAEGGKTVWDNIISCCTPCNNKKGTQNTHRWKPRNKPTRPTYLELVSKVIKHPIVIPDKRWVGYMGWKGTIKVHNWKDNYIV